MGFNALLKLPVTGIAEVGLRAKDFLFAGAEAPYSKFIIRGN